MNKFHIVKFELNLQIETNGETTIGKTRDTRGTWDTGKKLRTRAPARLVQVNDTGQRVNESHPNAELTDHEVQLLLQLRDEGFSYAWLATKFEISKSQAGRICRGEQRAQIPARLRRALAGR